MSLTFVEDSATISTTEYSLPADSTTLAAQTDDCMLQVWLDLANLAAGDQFELKIYEKITSAGSQRLVTTRVFTGVQSEPGWALPALIVGNGWDVTLKKLAGTDRSIAWSLRKAT